MPQTQTPLPALDIETATRLRTVIGRLSRRLRTTAAARQAGLTPTKISVLLGVARTSPIRLADLAASEGLNPTLLSRVTTELVGAGLLERSSDPDDRRAAWVRISRAGQRLAERMRSERTDAVNSALRALSAEERRQLGEGAAGAGGAGRRAQGAPSVTRVLRVGRTTFASFSVPNYRRYYGGQAISLIGTWMQMTAQAWLVLSLTHSSTALGVIIGLQTIPVLLLAPYGGVLADRMNKRRVMIALQSAMGFQALVLGLLTVTGVVRVWEIGMLAVILGLNNAFENPARQSFMLEMVGSDHLRNAVSLNSVLVNVARTVGPAVAGLLIAGVGVGVCFLVNAVSFVAVIASLLRLDLSALNPTPPQPRARGQLREGLRYVRRTPELAIPLLMMGAVGCLTYEFQVSLPVMARSGLHVGATGFGFMTASMGVGAVVGGLLVATRGRTGLPPLVMAASVFGVAVGLAALAPSLPLELAALGLGRRRPASPSWPPATPRFSSPLSHPCAGG